MTSSRVCWSSRGRVEGAGGVDKRGLPRTEPVSLTRIYKSEKSGIPSFVLRSSSWKPFQGRPSASFFSLLSVLERTPETIILNISTRVVSERKLFYSLFVYVYIHVRVYKYVRKMKKRKIYVRKYKRNLDVKINATEFVSKWEKLIEINNVGRWRPKSLYLSTFTKLSTLVRASKEDLTRI